VGKAMNKVDQVTQRNAAMVEDVTALSISPTHEANRLVRLNRRFRVGDEAAGRRAYSVEHPANVVDLPRRARKSLAERVAAGALAMRKDPTPSDDRWAEF
jgi:hypothetical protein